MDRWSLQSKHGTKFPPTPTVCCVAPYSDDKLRLINFPPNLLPAFRNAIVASWTKGIQYEGNHYSNAYYKVKLHGNPWHNSWNESAVAVESCRLTTSIMRFMLSNGWALEVSTQLKCRSEQDSWFFHKKPQQGHDVVMCGLSFGSKDKIRIVDGPPEVTGAVCSTIVNHWDRGLQRQRVHCGADEFKLNGCPWHTNHSNHGEKAQVSALIMYMIDALRNTGWTLYASVGTAKSDADGRAQMETFILIKSNAQRL